MNLEKLFSASAIASVAERFPLTYFDIGSRGGFQSDLHPLSFAVNAVGFEPDPIEYKQLQDNPEGLWKSQQILPQGVGVQTGTYTLYIPIDPQSASILKHDTSIGEKFDKRQFFEVDRTKEIQTLGLADALLESNLNSIDFLKIDIEGPELSIFESSPEVMREILAVKTEVSYIPFRHDQPLAGEIEVFLRRGGFELMEIMEPAHWRRHGYLIHPYYSLETPPYSKAQIVQADYLFFRDPDTIDGNISRLLKLSLISMALGYFDHALMILERPDVADYVRSEFNYSPKELVVPASKLFGRKMFYQAAYGQIRGLTPFLRYCRNLWR